MTTELGPPSDIILTVTDTLYWGMIEIGAGVLAACLPTLQFLIRNGTWEPIIRTTRGIPNSTASITRLLRTRPSNQSLSRNHTADIISPKKAEISNLATHCPRWGASTDDG
ncbi:hypothetical protein F4677DRAFT_433454 [Hypoxylon crocopeplum]|nr:hypothetical protein F4677DRAFT_433454 [Hypoxylon crocopeplum]